MLFPDESYRIMGACFEVHNRMGAGFLEAVYQECLAIEFGEAGIPFVQQPSITLSYRGRSLGCGYRADFVCYGSILVEIKAVDQLAPTHEGQVLNYLNATGLDLGLLINFGSHPKLESKRIALTNQRT